MNASMSKTTSEGRLVVGMHHGSGNGRVARERLSGMEALRRLKDVGDRQRREQRERGLDLGLEAAPSVQDRTISLFSRGEYPAFAGINTFTKAPYCENIRDVGKYDVAVVGAPFDMGTTYRAGARFGPQAVRRISALYDAYSPDMGVDLMEEIDICDVGDIYVIPSNIEKTFDQVDLAISYIHEQGAFPVIIGGDHSIGYPDVRAIAPHVGKLGIIHFDRHIYIAERTMDERMHTTPWFHATDIPNAPPSNLVQIGIGGWIGNRPGIEVAQDRDTTVISISDVEELGVEGAMEIALECAWKDADAVFLSFDIDCVDPGFAPGTGTPEPGGLLPREALKALRKVAREGICGFEVVEIAPEYDHSDVTAQLGARAIMDVLGTLVEEGHLGTRPARKEREQRRAEQGKAGLA
jgi:agmatinase